MFDVGFSEVSLVFVVALMLMGPQKLAELVQHVTRFSHSIKKTSMDLRQRLEDEMAIDDLNRQVESELEASGLIDSAQGVASLPKKLEEASKKYRPDAE